MKQYYIHFEMKFNQSFGSRITGLLLLVLCSRTTFAYMSCFSGITNLGEAFAPTPQTCATKPGAVSNQAAVNSSYSLSHIDAENITTSEEVKFCLAFVFTNGTSLYSCDYNNVCLADEKSHKVCYSGGLSTVYCCAGMNCNAVDSIRKETSSSSNLTCYSGPGENVSCGGYPCLSRKISSANGTVLRYEFGCANESICVSPVRDGCQSERTSSSCHVETCYCSSGHYCNHPNMVTPSAHYFNMTNPLYSRKVAEHRRTIIVTLVAAFVFVASFVVAVVFAVKKIHQHRAQHQTYTYTQLTADLAEERRDDDEYMLIG